MTRITLYPRYTPEEAEAKFRGVLLTRQFAREQKYKVLRGKDYELRTPDGKLVAMLLANRFTPAEQAERHDVWNQVKGSLGNRSEVFGKDARQPLLTVGGKPTARDGVPPALTKALNVYADMLGIYRYPTQLAGKPRCRLTSFAERRPDLLARVHLMALELTQIFREELPAEAGEQQKYIDLIPPEFVLDGTLFTTPYGIKNMAVACHTDEFDIPTGTGVITSSGSFEGMEFCFPEFHIAIDLQPSDVLFCDVHRLHGNLPLKPGGEVVYQVYFVRKNMHECGKDAGAFSLADEPEEEAEM